MAQQRNLGNRLQLVAPELLTTDVWLPTLTSMDRASLSNRLRLALGFFCDQSVAREALATSGALRASKYSWGLYARHTTLCSTISPMLQCRARSSASSSSVKALLRIARHSKCDGRVTAT